MVDFCVETSQDVMSVSNQMVDLAVNKPPPSSAIKTGGSPSYIGGLWTKGSLIGVTLPLLTYENQARPLGVARCPTNLPNMSETVEGWETN